MSRTIARPAAPDQARRTRAGIGFMIATTLIFAVQDGLSRHLAERYSILMIVMIRYWFFAAFVTVVAARMGGGLRKTVATRQPFLQVFRGVLLAAEICVTVLAFVVLGLVETHAVFASYPLIVAALSGPVLGERVGWRRWMAIGVGFCGILVILQPGRAAISPGAGVAFLAALMFALYGLLTRYAARRDSAATSFFWTGTAGAVAMTLAGLPHLQPIAPADWGFMAALCCTGVLGHWCLIRAYDLAEAGAVQPFAYLQLVFASAVGVAVFGEPLRPAVVLGAALVVAAGLFTLWRARIRATG